MERRSLSAGVLAIPNVEPEEAREFITQERRPSITEGADLSVIPDRYPRSHSAEPTQRRRRTKSGGVTPVALIPVTIRLRPHIAGALKRASLERQLSGEEPFTQQDLVEQAIEPWLRINGYLA